MILVLLIVKYLGDGQGNGLGHSIGQSLGHGLGQPVCSGRLTNDDPVIIEDRDSSPGRQWLLRLPRFDVLPWCWQSLIFIP